MGAEEDQKESRRQCEHENLGHGRRETGLERKVGISLGGMGLGVPPDPRFCLLPGLIPTPLPSCKIPEESECVWGLGRGSSLRPAPVCCPLVLGSSLPDSLTAHPKAMGDSSPKGHPTAHLWDQPGVLDL